MSLDRRKTVSPLKDLFMSNFFVAVGCGSFAQKLRGAHACGLALRLSIENAVLEQLQPCIRAAMTQLFAA